MNTEREYLIAHAAIRESKIRSGLITPRPDDAGVCRWSEEGPVNSARLDTIHNWRKRVSP